MNDSPTDAAGSTGAITITHTNEDGTLVEGTARGDGSRDALRDAGFRWSRNLDAWFMPQSRGFGPRHDRIDLLAAGLRKAGFTVTVEIAEYDAAATFHARQEAAGDRGARLDQRAEEQRSLGDARDQAARRRRRHPVRASHRRRQHRELAPRRPRPLPREHGRRQRAPAKTRRWQETAPMLRAGRPAAAKARS